MNKFKLSFIVLIGSLCAIPLMSQDLIYSQFNAMPLAVNPAFAGNNACNYRVSAIGRSQWTGVQNVNSYKSGTIAGDFNLNNVYNEQLNLWGLGLMASYDQAGVGAFTNFSVMANLAYHARFGMEGQNFLSFGMGLGLGNRGANIGRYTFASELDAFGRPIPNMTSGESFNSNSIFYPEVNFGALITLNPNENTNLYGGASIMHLLSPNISFTNNEYKLPMRVNFHAGANLYRGGFFILPTVYVQYQQHTNYNVGGYFGTTLVSGHETRNPIIGYLGFWYKSNDAIVPSARLDVGRMSIAFSYDLHIGGVSQNLSGVSSPELSVNFYGCFGRSSKRTGCPSL
ncbi:MAG: PorP/SprF family type IX secretion system membrane protein [Chitinophagales bacterium]|jgi:type IX secretion system PorP/SprF family membrane protein|nr:PorP/SprF family type IX secretion system membrane protein [Sphingobacteriales bacterium]